MTFKETMKIKNLNDLEVFVLTAESGSLSGAAREMNTSPASTSASLKRLETDLGLMLFVRSTRSLRLTPEGQRLLPACKTGVTRIARRAGRVKHRQASHPGALTNFDSLGSGA